MALFVLEEIGWRNKISTRSTDINIPLIFFSLFLGTIPYIEQGISCYSNHQIMIVKMATSCGHVSLYIQLELLSIVGFILPGH